MEELLKRAADLGGAASQTKQDAVKTRRKSRDLEEQLSDMSTAAERWNNVSKITRRTSRDYTGDALRDAFSAIDTDKSGYIDFSELSAAIKKMDPEATEATVKGMIEFADTDDDKKVGLAHPGERGRVRDGQSPLGSVYIARAQVSFEEFTKIMLYKAKAEQAEQASN